MRNLYYFTKKELFESWRTYRLLLLVIIFLIFGLMNPLLAKLTPEIVKMAISEEMAKTIPKPTSLDSWTQFYKNLNQIGLIVLALMFSGTVSNEISKGTLINLVTKGLRRWTIIIGKTISLMLQWSFCLLVTFLVTWGYTAYYFPDNKSPYLFHAVFPLWLFGLLLLSVILFTSTIARNNYEGLLMSGGMVTLLALLNMFDKVKRFNPISLTSQNMIILQNSSTFKSYVPAMILSILLFFVGLFLSVLVFNRKKL
ncbi:MULTISPECIES: ABC transporter permease subunit [Enterococcus]|uniref:ABC transporter permease subunit n=1 Tax=Candidatus Enterococcus murrayae TaxID=2815321 RepID=A0ABS3HCN2_9ENTE|nr:ABC transporter permease subunit [Enterococcus sp. MJM16]